MRRNLILPVLLFLIALEIFGVYFIMPFPGSQKKDTLQLAYWLHNNIWWLRMTGYALALYSLSGFRKKETTWRKTGLILGLLLYGVIFYFVNFRFMADKMFYQPTSIQFSPASDNNIAEDKLVLGIIVNGEAKAYPIQLIGYHHQVRDSIGGKPVMVTYCTVCRTGRVFEPIVRGQNEVFRLVGMDKFNAMFEDASTKSWWQQVNGTAVAGPLKGATLNEIPASQVSLSVWLRQYPNSLILQEDPAFRVDYEHLAGFDKGLGSSALTTRDSASWKPKSWVIGITKDHQSKAYDWNELLKKRIIQDSLFSIPIILTLEKDSSSFHAWNAVVDGQYLVFKESITEEHLQDINTLSLWNMDGQCIDGSLKGSRLEPIQSSQEFWHSWQTFHPGTAIYANKE